MRMSEYISGSIQNGICCHGTSPARLATSEATTTGSAREAVPARQARNIQRPVRLRRRGDVVRAAQAILGSGDGPRREVAGVDELERVVRVTWKQKRPGTRGALDPRIEAVRVIVRPDDETRADGNVAPRHRGLERIFAQGFPRAVRLGAQVGPIRIGALR